MLRRSILGILWLRRAATAVLFDSEAAMIRRSRCLVPAARVGLAGLALASSALRAHGEPSVPWTPSPVARHALELLVDEAGLGLTTTQWPLPASAVTRALDALPAMLAPALDEARDRVRRELARSAASQGTITLRGTQEALAGFGEDATPGSFVALRSSTFDSAWLALQLGARIDLSAGTQGGAKLRFDDSALVTEALGVQLQAWSHRSWWSPGWQSSLVLGNNAPAFSGVGLQRASGSRSSSPWLAWLGPWNFEMFAAQAEDVGQPANPYFIGQRLTLRPLDGIEIGLTRTAQWGGRGRPQGLKSFVRMLAGTGVNADTAQQEAVDPANEMAGFDLRARCPSGAPCAVYLQLIGEDRAGLWPSRYLGLYGIETWSADGRERYFAEYAETACRTPIGRPGLKGCAYRNYAYPEGYTSGGRWVGAGVGPDSRILTLGWLDADTGTSIRLSAGRVGARTGRYSPFVVDPAYAGRLIGVSAQREFQWGAATVAPEVAWQHVSASQGGQNDLRIGARLQMSLDATVAGAAGGLGRSLSSAAASNWQPLCLSAGLVLGAALLDRPVDDYVQGRVERLPARALGKVGSAIPIAGVSLASLSWFAQRGTVQGDVAQSALLAGVSALVVSEAGKLVVDRSRPVNGVGASRFGDGSRQRSSFPSIHSAVAWAVLTPYAKYYDAPWLYGLAALTAAGRVAERQHWVSDTVAGALVGYWLGDRFYRGSDAATDASGVRLWISPRAVTLQMLFD